ncbi:hypothetical protein BDV37DRAFT_251199 [Aspergillus pseudonomiae]|uniref:Uncharacterized protein n=1 Tax=Aspergillus pseudonomiae TaxID=1506151 RepID=A0A5N7D9G2_9EURO|nr:uncharacterized protein BDV37DRAFT_251199 [Aspergillus pseudonomiae]KAE8403116.1 hypothetical protein BDV37DRAFT_251199 [Aspergillus pseudonomiae]
MQRMISKGGATTCLYRQERGKFYRIGPCVMRTRSVGQIVVYLVLLAVYCATEELYPPR